MFLRPKRSRKLSGRNTTESSGKAIKSGARFSSCRKYRYVLWRIWDDHKPTVLFVGLNPSKADESDDDPTVRRCMAFARSWGYGGIYMANLFALVSPTPSDLKIAVKPIGPYNNRWLKSLSKKSKLVVAHWGNWGRLADRSRQVRILLPNMHCLAVNKTGEPTHVLYLRKELEPFPFVAP